jgi:hypothetical protein
MKLLRLARAAALLAALPSAAFANSGGATPYTLRDAATSCGGCHGASNPALTVSFSGPTVMLPGNTSVWTATLTGTPQNALAGFAAALQKPANNAATFGNIAGQPTVTGDGMTQVSHGSGQGALDSFAGGSAQYTVNLTVPAGAALGSTYQVYMSGNVGSVGAGNWKAATTQTLTVGAPVPTSLTPNQATATATTIALAWAGTQGEHFRILRKTGSAPNSATDAGATLVYEGANTSATATGLTAGTLYYFAAYGKVPAVASYSATAVQATAGTTPANPTGLTAMASSSTEVSLAWTGTSAEFRVLGKSGAYPTDPNDAAAEVVYQGTAKNVVDGGLLAGTQYFYRVWGKTAGAAAYSTANSQATATTTAQPVDRFVAASGNDQAGANPCTTAATPCRTITRAMTAAGSGDSIFVQPGTYSIAGGEVFPITFKGGVQLVSTGSPADTFIDGSGDAVRRGLFVSTGNASMLTRLQGFTVRNGVRTDTPGGSALGGALYINAGINGLFTVTGNLFTANQVLGADADGGAGETGSLGWGGAIAIFNSTVNITNNVFTGNLARGGHALDQPGVLLSGNENGGNSVGGAIYFAGSGLLANNTFVGNLSMGGDGGTASNGIGASGQAQSGAVDAGGNPSPTVINNIFAGNAAVPGAGTVPDPPVAGALDVSNPPVFSDNLFFNNREGTAPSVGDDLGLDAVLADPKFHSDMVLRLRNSSPARAAGTAVNAPTIDFEELARPAPPSIGAYEAAFLSQALQFGPAPTVSAGGTANVVIGAGASSSPVVLTSQTPGTCTVQGTVVTGVAAGSCTLLANQAADVDFTAAPQVSQTFNVLSQPSFALGVTFAGTGSGSVSSSPAGIQCGPTCSANFASNTSVMLSASAHAGSVFTGWGGDCSGTQPTCQVGMSQARNVVAQFGPDANGAVRVFVDGFED